MPKNDEIWWPKKTDLYLDRYYERMLCVCTETTIPLSAVRKVSAGKPRSQWWHALAMKQQRATHRPVKGYSPGTG